MESLSVKQQGGLGDIFFIQKLCKVFSQQYDVYHYVTSSMWNAGCDQLETPVSCGPSISIPSNSLVYDCSAQANGRPQSEVMTSKYDGAGVSWDDWRDYFKYKRDHDRENTLRDRLVKDGEPFILANRSYSFNKVHKGVDLTIPKDYDGKVIWMDLGVTQKIFDWCWMIENAEQIHIVETSINYIIDTLDLKAETLVCHPRHFKNTERCIGHLFNAPWQWVQYEEEFWKTLVS